MGYDRLTGAKRPDWDKMFKNMDGYRLIPGCHFTDFLYFNIFGQGDLNSFTNQLK